MQSGVKAIRILLTRSSPGREPRRKLDARRRIWVMRNTQWFFGFMAGLCICCTVSRTATATIVMVAVRPDGVWVIADGLRSSEKTWASVCKVHEVYGGVLLKFGYTNEPGDSRSTDDDIEDVIHNAKSFSEFKEPARKVLMEDVAKGLTRITSTYPQLAADTLTPPPDRQLPLDTGVGIVFIHVNNGQLAIEELDVAVGSVPVQSVDGTVYHVGVPTPEWESVDGRPRFLLYPKTIGIPLQFENKMLEDPTLMPKYLQHFEGQTPCHTGEPNAFLQVSPNNINSSHKYKPKELEHLRNSAVVSWINMGACPSWSVTAIDRPPQLHTIRAVSRRDSGLPLAFKKTSMG